ncbi:MAG: DUF6132 family protein [Caulobacterales bacterium]
MATVLRALIPIAAGAALGALAGHFGHCTGGTCPLTSTWWRGALYGAVLGLLWGFGSRHS